MRWRDWGRALRSRMPRTSRSRPQPADGLTTSEHYTHVAAGTGILPYPHYLAALGRTPAALAGGLDGERLPLILHGLDETQVPAAVAFLRASIAAAGPTPGVVGCR